MRPKSFIPALFCFLFLLIYCNQNNNSTQPEEPQPGARNYVWQLDTLDMPINYISSIWCASPENVARMIGLLKAECLRLKPGLR